MNAIKEVYNLFAVNVIKKDWLEAYNMLREYMTLTENKDQNTLLYSLLLEELLKMEDTVDFSFISNLSAFKLERINDYHAFYNLGYEQIISRDYEKAKESFKNYRVLEKANNRNSSLETVVIEILLEEVTSLEFKNKVQKYNEAKVSEQIRDFKYYFRELQNNINSEDYELALESCEEIKKFASSGSQKYYIHISKLLKQIINMSKNHCSLPKETLTYPNIEDYNFILDLSLKNGDYKTAYKNVGKCLYHNPNSSILKIYRTLLRTISDLDKKYTKKISTVLTDDYLLKLINEKKYNDLKVILSKNLSGQNETFYLNLLKLINFMNDLSTGKTFIKKVNNYEYQSNTIINNFYEALNIGDYEYAYKIIDICIRENQNDYKKLIIYKNILKDVINIINKYQASNDKMLKVKEYDIKIDYLLNEIKLVNSKDLDNFLFELLNCLKDKKSIDSKLRKEEEYLFNLIETYFRIKGTNIDFNNYFSPIVKGDNVIDSFNKAMKYGDYKTALDIMNSDEWFNNNDKNDNIKYYSVIRKILINLSLKSMNKNKSNNIEDNENISLSSRYLENLANLKRLIKKREYIEALEYLNENDFSYQEESKIYYEMLLKYLINLQTYQNECETESKAL